MTLRSRRADDAPPAARTGSGRLREMEALRHLVGPVWRRAALGIGATIGMALVLLGYPLLSKILIDDGIKAGSRSVVLGVAVVATVLAGVGWVLRRVKVFNLIAVSNEIAVSLPSRQMGHLQALPLGYHDVHPTGVTLSRLTNDVMAARGLFVLGIPFLVQSVVSATGALVIMLVLDWEMALVTLPVVPVLALISWIYRRAATPRFLRFRDTLAEVTTRATESLSAVEVAQTYNQTGRHQTEFAEATLENRNADYGTIRANALYYPATSLLSAVAKGLLVIYGGAQVVRGDSEVGTMVAFFGYLQLFLAPLVNFSLLFENYQAGIAGVDKIFSVLREPAESGPSDAELPEGPGDVSVTGVTTHERGQRVLDGVDLEIPGGSIVAVVGEAGSGRRQMGRLLAGLLAPTRGSVMIDGVDIAHVTRTSLYRAVAYVAADEQLLDGTVRDNLRLGAGDLSDGELLDRLGDLFGGEGLGSGLGLGTPVGRDGRKLPAGRRERLLIARAVLTRPRVLILDQATDSLDARSIARLPDARRTVLAGMTIIAVTRQPLVARYADRVVVLADGRPVEQGTPAELIRTGNHYARIDASWEGGSVAP